MIAVIICLTLSLSTCPHHRIPRQHLALWSEAEISTMNDDVQFPGKPGRQPGNFFFEWNAIRNKTLKRCAHTQTSHVQKYYSYGWRNIKWIEMWIRKRRWWVVPSWYERFSPLPIETQMPVEVTGARIETKFISRFRTNFWGVTSQKINLNEIHSNVTKSCRRE